MNLSIGSINVGVRDLDRAAPDGAQALEALP
jgi:hypothetical protein